MKIILGKNVIRVGARRLFTIFELEAIYEHFRTVMFYLPCATIHLCDGDDKGACTSASSRSARQLRRERVTLALHSGRVQLFHLVATLCSRCTGRL